ncbi:MAG: two-component system sensor histidine kinase NtrB [Acidobacteriaceae bacterium]
MKELLTNPVVLRAILTFVMAMAVLVLGVMFMRRMRHTMVEKPADRRATGEQSGFALEAYHGVIQRLKEQEQELVRLRAEASARASATENMSAVVLTNLTSGVLLFNNMGTVQQANQAARTILGYASPLGLHARDIFRTVTALRLENGEQHSTGIALVQAVQIAIGQGTPFRRMEADYKTPSGENRVLGITLSPVKGSSGEGLGAACLVSDLTTITALEREARTRQNMAALGEMSAGIAHEFKNSLATISGYAQMLARSEDESARDFGQRIRQETDNLTRVVSDFLAFARGPQKIVKVPVELAPLLEDCARETAVDLHILDGADIVLSGDRTALRQAVANLFRNSAEAKREKVRIEVSTTMADNTAEIRIKDNGPGIPPDVLEKIFIPFYTTKSNGTGLGLALVHRIVTDHGGKVTVVSGQEGTTFILSLPVAN